ncbi:hypothetical protein AVEN_108921-1, partial [Araneus ventricosus]
MGPAARCIIRRKPNVLPLV